MKIKRLIGTGKIFLYSCGVVIGIGFILWLAINGAFAVYISDERVMMRDYYRGSSCDILTPGIILIVSMAIFYRYRKMCSANSASGIMNIRIFAFLSLFCSAGFAGADLMFTRLVLQRVYGGIVCTRFEMASSYLSDLVYNYAFFADDWPITGSPYTTETLMMIFAITTLYYFCFWVIGTYFMRCLVYRKWKRLVFTGIATILVPVIAAYDREIQTAIEMATRDQSVSSVLKTIIGAFMLAGIFLDPVLLLFIMPNFFSFAAITHEPDELDFYIFVLVIFALVMLLYVKLADKGQFPGKRRIKKALENYNSGNNLPGEL